MKRFLQLSLFLFIGTNLFGYTGKYFYYTGTIGKYPIEMTLYKDAQNKITGFYHYIGKRGVLNLEGKVDAGNNLSLDERVYSYASFNGADDTSLITGNFYGNFIEGKSLDGKWYSRDGKKQFDFQLSVAVNGNGMNFSEGSVKTDSLFENKKGENIAEEQAEIAYLQAASGNDSVDKKINQFIFSALSPWTVGEDSHSFAEKIRFPNYQKLTQDFVIDAYNQNFGDTTAMDAFGASWTWSSSADVIWNGSGILSLAINQYEYSGGAHGNYSISNYSIDLATGDTISLKDIFLPGYNESLRKSAVKHLSQDPDFMPRDSLPLNNNFFINPEGICFLYNPYEISSYAAGISYAFIPWSDVNKWIDPKGIMGWAKK